MRGIGTSLGFVLRPFPRFIRRPLAIGAGTVLQHSPQMVYAVLYGSTDAFIKHLFFGKGEYVPVAHTTPGGVVMELNIAEKTQRLIYLGRPYEAPLTKFIESYLKKGRTFFDIGAHQGYYTLLASSIVGPLGVVVSFEPSSHNFEKLEKNVDANNFNGRVQLVKKAVGGENREITLHLNPLNDGGASVNAFTTYHDSGTRWTESEIKKKFHHAPLTERVEMITLDQWHPASGVKVLPDLIKIDIEGNELPALQGMDALIQTSRPHILVEIADFTPAHEAFLKRHSYSLARISKRGIPQFVRHTENLPRGNYLLAPHS